MGFRQAAVLSSVSFFLGEQLRRCQRYPNTQNLWPGVLFICFNVDHRILYGQLNQDVIQDGFQFYTTFFNAPPAIKVHPSFRLPAFVRATDGPLGTFAWLCRCWHLGTAIKTRPMG
jgi:hypothetical protein